jgi:hypothetical protein
MVTAPINKSSSFKAQFLEVAFAAFPFPFPFPFQRLRFWNLTARRKRRTGFPVNLRQTRLARRYAM